VEWFDGRVTRARAGALVAMAALLGAVPPMMHRAHARPHREGGHYLVEARSGADLAALKASLPDGASVDTDLAAIDVVTVTADAPAATELSSSDHVTSMARLGVRRVIEPEHAGDALVRRGSLARNSAPPRPTLRPLLWNIDRVDAPNANTTTRGAGVTVAVADTGIDAGQPELAGKVVDAVDLTVTDGDSPCKVVTGLSDGDLPALYGVGTAASDWNGHGTFVAGLLAASSTDDTVRGVAPDVHLVDIKIAQWCGLADDSSILKAMLYAADHGVDVLNLSIGGYLDRSTPDGDALYRAYARAVSYARRKGTVIVAAAGNDHVRVGNGGEVLSHGRLTSPGEPLQDLYGLYDIPGGLPGVVMVSATANQVGEASPECSDDSLAGSFSTCKPSGDAHQPFGVGAGDQLAYYSNYGPRIDVAGPGGAREFNVPNADRGGAVTAADGTSTFGVLSIASDFAVGPDAACVTVVGLDDGRCYNVLQGTSFAAPHVAGVAALAIAGDPELRHHPRAILDALRDGAREVQNFTPRLSATDTSPGDVGGPACDAGYCHLGGRPIRDREAYGAGVVDAVRTIDVASGHH